MENPVDQSDHITQTALLDFAAGRLKHDKLMAAAEHIAGCKQCAAGLAEAAEAKRAAVVPAGFDEQVLSRISRARKKKTELLYFSFRVALAACVALFFIFSSALDTLAGPRDSFVKINAPDFSAVESINTHLQHFSQQILNMEVFQHAQETK